MWPDLWKGALYMHPILQLLKCITQWVVKQLSSDLFNIKFIPQTIAQLQAELCLVIVGKLDACLRLLFANPVTINESCGWTA